MNVIENIVTSNSISSFGESSLSSPYDWYDYSEVIYREDTIIENQNKCFDLLNDGFTFISCTLIIILLYNLIRNMIRK